MAFQPNPNDLFTIDGTPYGVGEHPAARGMPYGQEGRQAIVYQLVSKTGIRRALKVFKPRFRVPSQVSLSGQLAAFASLPGLTVCSRYVLDPRNSSSLLQQHPDLIYAVLMPWIDGPTWQEIITEGCPLSQAQALAQAKQLTNILTALEERGLAHDDLSGANVLLPGLASGSGTSSRPVSIVELIDVEQLYAPSLSRPAALPAGSPGYAHRTTLRGVWEPRADRFAGAVLLAEILAWPVSSIRAAAWGESFFDPAEMQRPSQRYLQLRSTLSDVWGSRLAELFRLAWSSEALADCPVLGEWLVELERVAAGAIKAEVPSPQPSQPPPKSQPTPVPAFAWVPLEATSKPESLPQPPRAPAQPLRRPQDAPIPQTHTTSPIVTAIALLALFLVGFGGFALMTSRGSSSPRVSQPVPTLSVSMTMPAAASQPAASSGLASQSAANQVVLAPTPPAMVVGGAQTGENLPPTAIPPSAAGSREGLAPVSTATPACRDAMAFLSDLDVPDGAVFSQGASFVKTWRVQNTGTCTWDATYRLSFLKGERMSESFSHPLLQTVQPGQTTDIRLDLLAPSAAGAYRSDWILVKPGGMVSAEPLYVEIVVPGPAQTTPSQGTTPRANGNPGAQSPPSVSAPPPSQPPSRGAAYAAPIALGADNSFYQGVNPITLRWAWPATGQCGPLGPDEYFDVRVWGAGQPANGIGWTKDCQFRLTTQDIKDRGAGHDTRWAIAVIRGQNGKWQADLSPQSESVPVY